MRVGRRIPPSARGPIGRATRRFRSNWRGPLVSIVIAVSDEETTRIGACLDSVRAQVYRNLDVVVVPYGSHRAVLETAREHALGDWRIRVLSPRPDRAAARNAGVAAARGSLLMFVAGGDDLLPRSVNRLVAAHGRTGSELVVGGIQVPQVLNWTPDAPVEAAHHDDVAATTLERTPIALTDLLLGNRLFTVDFWRRAGLRFEADQPDAALVVGAYAQARAFDLLREPTYVPTGRRSGIGVGAAANAFGAVEEWIAERRRVRAAVEQTRIEPARGWWLWGVLDTAIQPILDDVERATPEQWAALQGYVDDLLDSADEHVWSMLGAESRVKLWLTQQGMRDRLEELVAARMFETPHMRTHVEDGVVVADLPFRGDAEVGVPEELYALGPAETRLSATLRGLRWASPERIEITVFASIDLVGLDALPEIECALVDPAGQSRLELPIEQFRDSAANLRGDRFQDDSWGAFTATVDVPALVAASDPTPDRPTTWHLEIALATQGIRRSGGVTRIDDSTSSGFLGLSHLGPRRIGSMRVGFTERAFRAGLVVGLATGPSLLDLEVAGRRVRGRLDPAGRRLTTLQAQAGGTQASAPLRPDGDALAFELALPQPLDDQRQWLLHALDDTGDRTPIDWTDPAEWIGQGAGQVVGSRNAFGHAQLLEAADRLVADRIEVEGREAVLRGRWLGAAPAEAAYELTAGAVAQQGRVTGDQVPDGGVEVRFDLVHDRWGLGATPLPCRAYWFTTRVGSGPARRVLLSPEAIDTLNRITLGEDYAWRVIRDVRSAGLDLMRPLGHDERGPFAQERLKDWFRTAEVELEEAVYLQSYVGAWATDSQRAIHEELRRRRPDLTLYWGVTGPESWVPPGAVAVTLNSAEWYRVLASARYLCLNIDPERWFFRRPGQRMLQTFHGYPAKSMGIRMWEGKHYTPRRIELELARTSGQWDLILTPAPEMDEHYRREYRYDGPIHSAGYPRDDLLVSPEAQVVRDDTRRRLGIAPHQKAILYAPTWRDDLASNWRRAEMVEYLDLEAASRALGPDYVLLMRGHRFHAGASRAAGTRLLDVTDYPEINHLILAADAAVLDYSSLRFDFALTRKPMVFLVPDLDTYVGGVRGFLYPFVDSAPGPLVDTADEAVRLLRNLDDLQRQYADALDRFHQQYNYLQDGRAAARVVEAFFGPADGPA